jgi:hypothetical protein
MRAGEGWIKSSGLQEQTNNDKQTSAAILRRVMLPHTNKPSAREEKGEKKQAKKKQSGPDCFDFGVNALR